jgi:hypothetical protein
MAGVSIATVCHYRQRWNIPSYRSTLSPEALAEPASTPARVAPAPVGVAPSLSPMSASGQQGYSVMVQTDSGQQRHITIATDIVAAARHASAAAKGRVVE